MMEDRQWFVLYVLVCLEVGFFLMLVPWSAVWERNYFLDTFPHLRPVLLSPSLRGAVCGLGLANIYLGIHEIFGRLRRHRQAAELDEAAIDRLHEPETVESKALAAPEER